MLGEALNVATKRAPTNAATRDLEVAMTAGKHVTSNAIVFAKDRATVGIAAADERGLALVFSGERPFRH